jgi:ferredoxin
LKIYAKDRKGKDHELEGRDGWSVMEILRDGGLDIAAECGGACACATCHVYVTDGWYEKLPGTGPFALVLPGDLQQRHRRHQGHSCA